MALRNGYLAAALGASVGMVTPAPGATPSLIWQNATAVRVQCLVHVASGAPGSLQTELCNRIVRLAARGAPVPVTVIELGNPIVLSPDGVTLLVHASLAEDGPRRLLAFSIRPFRASIEQSSVLYGAAPRAVSLSRSGAPTLALDSTLAAALADILPWQTQHSGPRPIEERN